MQRLSRAISEIESYRTALLAFGFHNGTAMVSATLLNSAIGALMQARALAPAGLQHGKQNGKATVDLMIAEINDELRATAAGGG